MRMSQYRDFFFATLPARMCRWLIGTGGLLCALSSSMFCLSTGAYAQATESTDSSTDATSWDFELDLYHYIVPHSPDNSVLMGYADYGNIHYEARYNYEDLHTGSVFGGYRLETGKKCVFGATPIGGVVFGNINGVAPGLLLDATWNKFDFYSESEYVVDFSESESNFFYTWSELAYSPTDFLRTGISANRTRLYQTDLELQRGVFAEYTWKTLTAGFHWFNPAADEEFFIATLAVVF